MSAKPTKKAKAQDLDTLRPEYQRKDLGVGVRGKYFKKHSLGSNLVILQPDVAKIFPTQKSVNDALRGLIRVAERVSHTN